MSTRHMTYQEATAYLFNSAPLFQNIGGNAYKEGLDNTHALDARYGHPHQRYRTIHVAGTNGKGSCSHTLAAILQCSGLKVGLYTSPHLMDFRERIRVNGKMIPEQEVIDFVEQERSFFEPLHPSFFELATALAFRYFARAKVDVAVIEVGLGGRLDCTNIISPDLSVITNISFDHVQFLGDTLEKIAAEKAGIIKPGTPVVVGEYTPETKPIFIRKELECNAQITFAEDLHEVCDMGLQEGRRCYQTQHFGRLQAELSGLCQSKNTATILAAVTQLRAIGYPISDEQVAQGFAHVTTLTGLMGRWQKLGDKPTIICDTGHNVGGITYIAEQLKAFQAERLHMVIGMVSDKDITHVLQLLPRHATYYFTQASVKRALPAQQLAALAQAAGLKGSPWPDVPSAYAAAIAHAHPEDVVFVGGSTFVVADLLTALHTSHQ